MSKTAESEGALETRGIEPVPDAERTAKTRELFPTWVAANISVLLLTMGASLVVAYKLNFWQAVVVAIAAPVVSYGLVGLIGIAGKRGGAPGMALSRGGRGLAGRAGPRPPGGGGRRALARNHRRGRGRGRGGRRRWRAGWRPAAALRPRRRPG
ncbi:cytosine permease, partial [Streptomyces sp. NPDC059524]|uniref:cytosine permease n=1 Tax=Streptomyces sp. NPDC059524 TaxID=3346856 RepID=UPI0036776F97